MLDCGFSFKGYAENVQQKATKYSLITNAVLLDADGHMLT